jgi:hypothetical protein
MTETEMMRRVVAILTQARDTVEQQEAAEDRSGLFPGYLLMGDLVAEMLSVEGVTVTDPSPQAVADALVAALQPRVSLMVGCFVAAYLSLAHHHDAQDPPPSSEELLRDMALRWEIDRGLRD